MKKRILSLLLAFCLLLTLLPSGLLPAWAQEKDELYLQMLDLGLVDESGALIEENSFTVEDGTKLASLSELVSWLEQCGEEDVDRIIYVDATGVGASARLMAQAISIEYGMEEMAEQFRLLASMDTQGLSSSELDEREALHKLSFYQTVEVDHDTDIVTVSTELQSGGKTVAAPYEIKLEVGLFHEVLPVSSTLDVAPDGDEFTIGANRYSTLVIPAGYSGAEFRLDLKKISCYFDSSEYEYLVAGQQENTLWDGNGYVLLQTRTTGGMPEQSQPWYLTVASKAAEDCAPSRILDFLENGCYVAREIWVEDSGSSGGSESGSAPSGHYEYPPFGKDAMKAVEKTSVDGKSVYKTTNYEMAHRQWGADGVEILSGMAMNAGVGDADDNAVVVKDLSFITKYDESALSKPPKLYYGVMDKWGTTMVGMEEAKTTTADMSLKREISTGGVEGDKYLCFVGNSMEGRWAQDEYESDGKLYMPKFCSDLMDGKVQTIRYAEVELPLVPDESGQYANPRPSIPWIYLIETGWDSKNAGIEGVCIPGKVYLKDTTAPTITEIRTTGGYYKGTDEDGVPIYTDETVFGPGEYMPIMVRFSEPVRGEYKLLYETVDADGNVTQGVLESVHADEACAMETGLMRDDYSTVSDRRTFYYPVDVTDCGSLRIVGVAGTDAVDTRGNALVQNGNSELAGSYAPYTALVGNMGGMQPQDSVLSLTLKADDTQPIADPRKYTATVQLSSLPEMTQEWSTWALGEEAQNPGFQNLEVAFVLDGDLSTRYPATLTDEGQLVGELLLPNVAEATEHILELYVSSVKSSDSTGDVVRSTRGSCYVRFTQQPLVLPGETAYTIQVDQWYSGMEGTVFMMDRRVPSLTAVDNGSSFTYKRDDMVYWVSDNEDVLRVQGSSADAPLTLADAKTIQLDRVGEGQATIRLMATNGSDDPAEHTAVSLPITIQVVDGGQPVLMLADNANTVLAQKNTDQTVYFTANLEKHQVTGGLILAELYEGPSTSTAAEPIYIAELAQSAKSITIPGRLLQNLSQGDEAAYTLKLSAGVTVAGEPVDLVTRAYLVVRPQPVKVELQGLENPLFTSDKSIDIRWTVENLEESLAQQQFTIEKDGKVVYSSDSASLRSYTLQPEKPEGLRDYYIVTVRVYNGVEWSEDSATVTVYRENALELTANGTAVGDSIILKNTIEGGTSADPTITGYDGKVHEGLNNAQAVARLRGELALLQSISINYKDFNWGIISDRISWSTTTGRDGGEDPLEDVVSLNFRQGNSYAPLESYSYTSYIPQAVMMLAGLRDGSATVTASHQSLDSLTDSVEVKVERLKDQLYLFQFTPAARTEVTYLDKNGVKHTVYSNDDGSLALFEPDGIDSDVQTASVYEGESYRGTLPQLELRSGEGNGTKSELYPLNTLELRLAAVAQMTLLRPDGEPLANTEVTLRGGVYRNAYQAERRDDAYCAGAMLAKAVGETASLDGRQDQVFTTDENGVLTVHMDLEQFTSVNDPTPVGVGDMLEFVFELRFAGDVYYPEIITVDSSLTKWDAQRSGEDIVTLVKADGPRPFVAVQTVSYTGRDIDVRRHSGVVGPSSNYEQVEMNTSVMLWGREVSTADTDYRVDMRARETGVSLPGQTLSNAAEASYPFSSIPLVNSSVTLSSDSFVYYESARATAMEMALFSGGSSLDSTITVPFRLVDLTAIEKVEDSASVLSLMANVAAYGTVGGANTDYGLVNAVSDGIMNDALSMLQKMGGETGTVKAVLTPTEDPTRYQAYLWTGLNTTKLEDLDYDTNGISLEPSYFGQDYDSMLGQVNDTFTLSDFQAMADGSYFDDRSGLYGAVSGAIGMPVMLVLEGWMAAEIRYDFDAARWRVVTTGGGFTAGGQLEMEHKLNLSPYGIPVVVSFKLRGGATVDFQAAIRYAQQLGYEWDDETATAVNDYLTALRINAYMEFFGSVGVESGVVARIGPFGTLEINNENRFLTRNYLKDPNEKDVRGQFLRLDGEAGIRAALGVGPVTTEITLLSLSFGKGWSFNEWDEIQDYWDEAGSGLGSEVLPGTGGSNGQNGSGNVLYSDGMNALVLADNTVRLQSRDYLDRAERQWLGGSAETMDMTPTVSELQMNAYPYSNPELTEDGRILAYLSDADSKDVTDVEARYTFNEGFAIFDNEGVAFPAPEGFTGYGDSEVDIDGKESFAGAVWLREAVNLDLPAGTVLTQEEQLTLLNGMEVVASIWDGSQWVSTRLTNNGSQELEPVIAVNSNGTAIAAWRSVQTDDEGMGSYSQNRILCKLYDGSKWSEETYTLSNGSGGEISGLSAEMLPDGTAAIAYTMNEDGNNGDIYYSVVDTGAEDLEAAVKTIRATAGENSDLEPQLVNAGDYFVMGWNSVSKQSGVEQYSICLRAFDKNGAPVNNLPESLDCRTAGGGYNGQFELVQGSSNLENLAVVWMEDSALRWNKLKLHDDTYLISGTQLVDTLPENTALDHICVIDSYPETDYGIGLAYVAQTTTYSSIDEKDPSTYEKVSYSYELDGETYSGEGLVPLETVNICSGGMAHASRVMEIDIVGVDYRSLRTNSYLPVTVQVTNQGANILEDVKLCSYELGTGYYGEEMIEDVNLMPGESRSFPLVVQIGDTVRDKFIEATGYWSNGHQESFYETLHLDYPDTGISHMTVTREQDGWRNVLVNLYNGSEVSLIAEPGAKARRVVMGVYSDAECQTPLNGKYFADGTEDVGYEIVLSEEEMAAMDSGTLSRELRFDAAAYMADSGMEELPNMGVTLFVKARIQRQETSGAEGNAAQWHDMPEADSLNNQKSITFESLLNRSEGEPVSFTVELENGESSTAHVQLRSHSLQPVQGGRLTAALLDGQGNVLETLSLGQLNLACEELQQKTLSFQQLGERVVLRYSTDAPGGANAASITLDGLPLTLESFDENDRAELDGVYAGQYLLTVVPEDPEATVTVDGEPAENGVKSLKAGYEDVTYTVTITSADGSSRRSYTITLRGVYYTLRAEAGQHGSISPEGTMTVWHGSRQSFAIAADEGYLIDDVLVDGVSVGAVESYTFEDISDNHSIRASFRKVEEPPVDDPTPPVDDPVDEPIDEPTPPVDEPIDEPVDEPVDEPIDEPVDGPVEKPATGDSAAVGLWVSVGLLACAAVVLVIRRRKQRNA